VESSKQQKTIALEWYKRLSGGIQMINQESTSALLAVSSGELKVIKSQIFIVAMVVRNQILRRRASDQLE
jgi:hypothetical protein